MLSYGLSPSDPYIGTQYRRGHTMRFGHKLPPTAYRINHILHCDALATAQQQGTSKRPTNLNSHEYEAAHKALQYAHRTMSNWAPTTLQCSQCN